MSFVGEATGVFGLAGKCWHVPVSSHQILASDFFAPVRGGAQERGHSPAKSKESWR